MSSSILKQIGIVNLNNATQKLSGLSFKYQIKNISEMILRFAIPVV